MTTDPDAPYAEEHRIASEALRRLTPEQLRARMRRAGVLGAPPQHGDKERVLDGMNRWGCAVVIGASADGQVHVAHQDGDAVAVGPLGRFAGDHRVQLVARPSPGHEHAAAARAAALIGARADLATFEVQPPDPPAEGAAAQLAAALRALGLVAAAVVLGDDREWDEGPARYRDARGSWVGG